MNNEYYTKSALLERGWTDSLIKKFLGNHDLEKLNPIYKSAAPMKLYLINRVETIEKTDEFIAAKEKSNKRSIKHKEIADIKRKELFDYINKLIIELPALSYNEVLKNAIKSYNEFHWDSFNYADENSDSDFLKRICINYLRHQCTNYDTELYKMFGKIGKYEGHTILQEKINNLIKEKYIELR